MEMKIDICEKDMKKIKEKVKEELGEEITEEYLKKYLKEGNLTLVEVLKLFGIYAKTRDLENTLVKDLSDMEKFMLVIKWILLGIF